MRSIASAPGKVILFGEHFVVYGVNAILGSIDRRVTVESKIIPENFVSIKSSLGNLKINTADLLKNTTPLLPFEYISKKMIDKFDVKTGIEIIINSDIPPGIGLGSSSACCVAGAASLSGLFENLSKDEIIDLALNAEQTLFKDASGADTTVSTFGGMIEYNKRNKVRKLDYIPNFDLIVVNSDIEHSTRQLVSQVRQLKEENEDLFNSLCDNEEKLIQQVNSSLKNKDIKTLGKCMSQNQSYLEKIGISSEKIRSMISSAEETCYGAKITGAGGGGCIIALADESNSRKTIDNLKRKKLECFKVKIDSQGLIHKLVDD